MSPARRWMPRRASASSQTRSSSARPTTSARTPSSMTSLIVTTSPVSSGWRASTTLKLSLSTTSLPRSSVVEVDVGVRRHLHLAAAGEDVDRAVVVLADDHAVGRRRLGELVDLVAQRGDVLARLAQGVAELLVLGDGLGQLALGLQQPLLERAHPLRGVGHLAPEVGDLVLERVDLGLQAPRPARRRCRARWTPSGRPSRATLHGHLGRVLETSTSRRVPDEATSPACHRSHTDGPARRGVSVSTADDRVITSAIGSPPSEGAATP